MTDVEDLLNADGTRWRAAQPPPPEPDLALLAGPARRSRWQPLAAAAVVTLVVAGAVAVAARRSPAPAPVPGAASTDEIVRDGDRVLGQGTVLARPGQPVRMCLPEVTMAIYPPPVPACRTGVTVAGLDLDRLSSRDERDGTVWGSARVEGVYRAGTVVVSRQEAPRPAAGSDPTGRRPTDRGPAAPDSVPCPEPAGGWTRLAERVRATGYVGLTRVVSQNSGELNDPYVAYPYGWHLQDQSDGKGTEVYVVGTTGDLEAARRKLEEVFPAEHLCVTRVTWSRAAMSAAETRLGGVQAQRLGFGRPSTLVIQDRVTVELLVLDEPASRYLAGVADGRVELEPMLRKLA